MLNDLIANARSPSKSFHQLETERKIFDKFYDYVLFPDHFQVLAIMQVKSIQ